MKAKYLLNVMTLLVTSVLITQSASAAIGLDRTRVIFDGSRSSETITVNNQNKTLPYLAQAWIENAQGQKIETPLTALPPLQRVEPGAKSQIKIQATGNVASLPQDRESIFWFNVREIPPKSNKANTLQIALQTRVKMFYRPAALAYQDSGSSVPQEKITLTKEGDRYRVNNPTGYYVTLVRASSSEKGEELKGFNPLMVEPKGNAVLGGSAAALGAHPVLTFISDYGGRPQLTFNCAGNTCTVGSKKNG